MDSEAQNLKVTIIDMHIRPEIENDVITDDVDISIIDMQRIVDPKFSDRDTSKLKFSRIKWGFFQVSPIL